MNVGVVQGGTTTNVVPAQAHRPRSTSASPRRPKATRIEAALQSLAPGHARARG